MRRSIFSYYLNFISMIMLTTCCLPSCDVHESPAEELYDLDKEHTVSVTVSHTLDMDESSYSYDISRAVRADATDSRHCVRYVFRAFPSGNTKTCVFDTTIYSLDLMRGDFTTQLTLPTTTRGYDMWIWSDYVDRESRSELYYKASTFDGVSHGDSYVGNSEFKDCFLGSFSIGIHSRDDNHQASVTMARPVGRYAVVATDLAEFMKQQGVSLASLSGWKVRVVYPSYTPSSVNLFNNDINNIVTNVSYESPITVDSSDPTRALLGFDYVMLSNSTGDGVGVAIQLYLISPSGNISAMSSTINVPMRRNRNTVVAGRFLTSSYTQGSGGVGINYSYAGEYVIFI